MVEGIDGFHTKLQPFALSEEERLVQAQIHIGKSGTATIADRAGSKRVSSRVGDVARVKPLDVTGTGICAGTTGHHFIHRVKAAVATRPGAQEVVANAIRSGGLALEVTPATELVQGQSISSVERHNSTDLPITHDRVKCGIHVVTELLAPADGKLIGDIAAQNVGLVVEARAPVCPSIVRILPSGLAPRAQGIAAAPTGAEIPRRVAQTFGIGVGDLPFETVTHPLLQHGLESIVALTGVGHVYSSNIVGSAQL